MLRVPWSVMPGATLEPAVRIGRYIVRHKVGVGGMGIVYAAYDPNLDRTVAVKLLHKADPGLDRITGGEARLRREAQVMAQLAHPNVIPVFDVGDHEGQVYIAMELVEGPGLDQWLAEVVRPVREITSMFFQAGLGLAAAHEAGIVHRDFKPANVLVGKDRRARVVDFGLAGPAAIEDPGMLADQEGDRPSDASSVTHPGLIPGTPAYMAPELYEGHAGDARSDQFAFSVALYEALYGERPFPGRTVFALLEQVRAGAVRPAPALCRVPAWIRRIVVRGLDADPDQRYPTMKAMLSAMAFTSRIMAV